MTKSGWVGLFVLIATGGLLAKAVVPGIIRQELETRIAERFEGCVFHVERIALSLIPLAVELENMSFAGGDPLATGVEARAERVVARAWPGRLELDGLQVVVTEGDRTLPPSKAVADEATAKWIHAIRETRLRNGKLTYVRVSRQGKAVLRFTDIQGAVAGPETAADWRAVITRAKLQGRLENSGRFELAVAMPLFSPEVSVDVDLRISGQNLADLNAFFEKNDGIRFTGSLHSGHASAAVQGRRLNVSVEAKYLGLNIQFQKTKERSGMETFWSNLAKSLTLEQASIGKAPREQNRSVVRQREARETLLHLILRGLRDAALEIATG